MNILAPAAFILLALSSCQREAAPLHEEKDPAKAAVPLEAYSAVVFIRSEKTSSDGSSNDTSEGTGFVFSPRGFVMTAGHVVFDDEEGYEVHTTATFGPRSGHPYSIQLVDKYHPRPDIALLQLPYPMDREVKWLKFGDSRRVTPGDALYALGFSSGLKGGPSISPGILSNPSGWNGNWQTTIPINPGQSGAPVFNSRGEVVAIAMAGDDDKQLVTYVVPGAFTDPFRSIALATDAKRLAESAVVAASNAEEAASKAAQAAGMEWEPGEAFGSATDSTDSMDAAMDAAIEAAADTNANVEGWEEAASIEQDGRG